VGGPGTGPGCRRWFPAWQAQYWRCKIRQRCPDIAGYGNMRENKAENCSLYPIPTPVEGRRCELTDICRESRVSVGLELSVMGLGHPRYPWYVPSNYVDNLARSGQGWERRRIRGIFRLSHAHDGSLKSR